MDIVVLEQDRQQRHVAEYVVIASARSERHLGALGRHLAAVVKASAQLVVRFWVVFSVLG